jgi:hypothetical protein
MTPRQIKVLLITVSCLILLAPVGWAGNKRLMSEMGAQRDAQRKIVETVYGFKVRATEQVQDMVAASYDGVTESKTATQIKGIQIDEVVYDPKRDIAKATASISLTSITNIDGVEVDLQGKVFKRVGFGTATPENAGPIKALRAAELDAYKQIAQQIVGFTLESETTVENYMLKSDIIKTKVLATSYLAEVVDFGWDENGDAYVKMRLNVSEVSQMMGEQVVNAAQVVEVEGRGAQHDDFSAAKGKQKQQ